jgi:hypothetical protein
MIDVQGRSRIPLIESACAAFIIGGLVYCGWHLAVNGYLPQPFFYEPFDTYADWFNTSFWAHDKGTYDVWKTIYPPLSFVFLQIFSIDRCYPERRSWDQSAGLAARDCDWVGMATLYAIFVINLVLVFITFRRMDRRTAIPRTIAVALGFPMVDALERGNLVLISFTCLLLAFAPILKKARGKWVAIGLAINFKVYLIAALVPLLAKRRWRWVESGLISAIVIYLTSFAILGRGTPLEIYANIREFSQLPTAQIMDLWYTSTYQPLLSLLKGDNFPFVLIIGSRNVDLLLFLIPALQHVTQGLIVLATLAVALRPEAAPAYRVANFGVLLALITSEAGGYTQIYFMLFVMMEPWRGFARKWAILTCYLLAVPLDITLDTMPPMARDLYFGGGATIINYHVTIGPFIRPLLIMTVAWAVSLVTIREVWVDVREQRWRLRWRFRGDAPLLVGKGNALPPG